MNLTVFIIFHRTINLTPMPRDRKKTKIFSRNFKKTNKNLHINFLPPASLFCCCYVNKKYRFVDREQKSFYTWILYKLFSCCKEVLWCTVLSSFSYFRYECDDKFYKWKNRVWNIIFQLFFAISFYHFEKKFCCCRLTLSIADIIQSFLISKSQF